MKVYPVVHINTPEVAVTQAHVALDLGADGVYLINHGGNGEHVFTVLDAVRGDLPSAFLGVNLLGYDTAAALEAVAEYGRGRGTYPNALWSDDIRSRRGDPGAAMQYKRANPDVRDVLLLGGIAFKYTATYTDDPAAAAAEVVALEPHVDVVTTSGPGTGRPPPVAKIAAMKQASTKPLAVASGISSANIADYAGCVDQVLVATSVETRPYSGIFDGPELARFIAAASSLA